MYEDTFCAFGMCTSDPGTVIPFYLPGRNGILPLRLSFDQKKHFCFYIVKRSRERKTYFIQNIT